VQQPAPSWLFDEGYTTLPKDATFGPGDIFYNFNNSKMCEEPPAPQVGAITAFRRVSIPCDLSDSARASEAYV
jgi:hypothetical protein